MGGFDQFCIDVRPLPLNFLLFTEFKRKQLSRRVLSRHLSDLVVYMRSIEFPGFDAVSQGTVAEFIVVQS